MMLIFHDLRNSSAPKWIKRKILRFTKFISEKKNVPCKTVRRWKCLVSRIINILEYDLHFMHRILFGKQNSEYIYISSWFCLGARQTFTLPNLCQSLVLEIINFRVFNILKGKLSWSIAYLKILKVSCKSMQNIQEPFLKMK